MTDEPTRSYFSASKIAQIKGIFRKELEVLAMTLPIITDGFMFDDRDLMTVLGKGSHKSDTDLYAEMLDVVRNNPINKRTVAKGVHKYITPLVIGPPTVAKM